MITARRDVKPAAFIGLAVLAQGLLLIWWAPLSGALSWNTLLVSVALAIVFYHAWRYRWQINHRIDMNLTMVAFGGLGMLVGWWVDADFKLLSQTVHACCSAKPHGGIPYQNLSAAFTWMTGLMLVGAIPPSIWWTRCAVLARHNKRQWIATHLIGNAAMVIGMILGGSFMTGALTSVLESNVVAGHIAMVIGMAVGMTIGTIVGEIALGLHPWSPSPWQDTALRRARAAAFHASSTAPSPPVPPEATTSSHREE